GANLYHPMLAEKPLRDLALAGSIQADLDLGTRTLTVEHAAVQTSGVEYRLDGFVRMPGGVDAVTGARREHARLEAHLVVPAVPCQTMLAGSPEALRPYLAGFKLRGTFSTDLRLSVDWADLEATELAGGVGIFGCKVLKEPAGEYGMARLEGSFKHYVEVEIDKWMELVIGPENPDFVPLWDVSPHLLRSLMTTEDARF